jgi:hypothetical protein
MYNRSIRRQGARTLPFLAVALGLAACGDPPTGQVGPETFIVEFEASGVVERDGQPVCGAKVVLMRCERMGTDGCEEEIALAIAMTNSDGEYALRYSCACEPGQEMPEHSLQIEMPVVVTLDRIAGGHDHNLIGLLGDPNDPGRTGAGNPSERRGHHTIDPECVERLIVNHDFSLGE